MTTEFEEYLALLSELQAEITHTEEAARAVPESARHLERELTAVVSGVDSGGGASANAESRTEESRRGLYTGELQVWRDRIDREVAKMKGYS